MKWYLGVDGGGTKTLAYVSSGDGQVRWQVCTGASNQHSAGDLRQSVADLFEQLRRAGGPAAGEFERVCFAGAGVDTPADVPVCRAAFEQEGCTGKIMVCSDGLGALVGAHGSRSGGMLIAGTGSIALGIDAQGRQVRAGGWGYRTDGGCSGYSLGVAGLRAALADWDGSGPRTMLRAALFEALNARTAYDVVDALYNQNGSVTQIASLAKPVVQTAAQDAVALQIVRGAVEEAAAAARAVARRLPEGERVFALCGSVFEKSELVRGELEQAFRRSLPEAKILRPRYNAAYGALLMAEKDWDVKWEDGNG